MKPARFRDASFHVEDSERAGGRKGVTHEYPQRDAPYREDLGRKSREFTLSAYVSGFGTDYTADRDALIAALETPGSGKLDHPYFGVLNVACTEFRVRESTSKGGMAEFSITFIETPAQPMQPTAIADTAGALKASAVTAQASVAAEFLAKYVTNPVLTSSVAGALRHAALAMNNALQPMAQGQQEAALMASRIRKLTAAAVSYAEVPGDLLASVRDLFGAFTAGSEQALLAIYAFDPGVRPPATTSNRIQEQINFDATQQLIQRLAVIQAAVLAVADTFDSYETAVSMREAINALLDDQADTAADDTYPALQQLRADITNALPGDTGGLPHLVHLTLPATTPSLVLSYSLYGSLDLDPDLLARNDVRYPGFVPGGVALTVLSNG